MSEHKGNSKGHSASMIEFAEQGHLCKTGSEKEWKGATAERTPTQKTITI